MTPAADDEDVGGAFALQCCYQGGDEDLVAAGVDLPILLLLAGELSPPGRRDWPISVVSRERAITGQRANTGQSSIRRGRVLRSEFGLVGDFGCP